ncbi:fibropellin-1-like isoform X2 [Dreissena polymorpha]|uniref:fibropellin-1-like isoform X2 n=1 Tax=Dreissena polymorpha TaxID=45954 RepID=UPI002263E224|nr:fibropellin-1-like isoform X2 [Dreissena polymorpha]
MRSGFKTIVSFAIGVFLATEQAQTTTSVPIRCLNGWIVTPAYGSQYCACNAGFMGNACDQSIPTIRCVHGRIANAGYGQYCVCNPGFIGEECDGVCEDNISNCAADKETVCKTPILTTFCAKTCSLCSAEFPRPPPISCVNGVITLAWTSFERCECDPGFTGETCDVHMPMEKLSQTDLSGSPSNFVYLIVGVSVGALILVPVILAAVLVCKRRQRLNNQQSAAHARRQPRDLRTGFSHGIYAIPGDLDFKLPPYTPPNFPPPYDHLDNKIAGPVGGKDSLSQPPPYYSNPGYQTMSSVRKESVGDEVVSVRSE